MIDLIKKELFVGNTCQTIGFYILLAVLLFVAYLQFKEVQRHKQTERLDGHYLEGFEDLS
jgi:hypothetical protein